jgi:hypothetical protein
MNDQEKLGLNKFEQVQSINTHIKASFKNRIKSDTIVQIISFILVEENTDKEWINFISTLKSIKISPDGQNVNFDLKQFSWEDFEFSKNDIYKNYYDKSYGLGLPLNHHIFKLAKSMK